MSIIKKIIAATTSVISVGAFSLASITAYADETTTTTTEAALETTETETTTSETSTETSSDTTTSTTAPASYNMWLSCNGNIEQENAVTVNANGTYTVKYKFTESDIASTVTSLVLESDINSEMAADVKFRVTGLKLGADEATAATIQYINLTDDAFGVNAESKCYYLNIIKNQNGNTAVTTEATTTATTDASAVETTDITTGVTTDGTVNDLGVDTVQFAPKADDTVFVTFAVEGLANMDPAITTTTTTTRTISYVGYGNNGGSSNGKTTTTNTVAQTADEGVVAIVVTAAAAVALAAGAMTIRKKRK